MPASGEAIAIGWLAEMQACVRAVDFERGRAIFAEDVVGFGTKTSAAIGLQALERDQWRHVWGRIRNFTFETDHLHCAVCGERGLWLACPWSSEGRGPDGAWKLRPGRITAVLERRDGRWLAVHTHHSVAPDSASQPMNRPENLIRPACQGESDALKALTVRSKAHWGYDGVFMDAIRHELIVTEEDILNDALYVHEQEGVVQGYCHLRPAANNEVWLESLFVEPEAMGTGVGRRLFGFAAQKGRELGFAAMTFESDPNAEPFYVAMGAIRTGLKESSVIPGRLFPILRFDL